MILQSDAILVEVAPEVGGRVVRFVDRRTGYDFLWRNAAVPLRREAPGAEYDPNFFGGIDELMPNDIPESISGVDCPDHGELWTLPFTAMGTNEPTITLTGRLPRFGFLVEKRLTVVDDTLRVHATVTNVGPTAKPFLWKLHAALAIESGDTITCPATTATVADPDWSRRKVSGSWSGETVPTFDNTTEFLYLHPLAEGFIGWRRGGKSFDVTFDPAVFPYAWYFASYGGFDGHRVAILEPCTTMPISVNEAHALGQCPVLAPGQSIHTEYVYRGVDAD